MKAWEVFRWCLLVPWKMLKWLIAGGREFLLSARVWVLCVLLLTPILGGLSHLVVARRMAFFSAALGQAALTGVSVGLLIGEPLNTPYGGMFGFCLLSTLAMIYVKRRSSLPSDTLIVPNSSG